MKFPLFKSKTQSKQCSNRVFDFLVSFETEPEGHLYLHDILTFI